MRFWCPLLAALTCCLVGQAPAGLAQATAPATGAALGDVWTWDVATGHADPGSSPAPQTAAYAWSADAVVKAVAQGGQIQISNRDHSTDRLTVGDAQGSVTSIQLDPSGRQLAIGTSSGYLIVWNNFRGKPAFQKQISQSEVSCIAFTSNGDWIAAAGVGIQIWETHQFKPLRPPASLPSWVTAIAFDPANDLAAGDFGGHLYFFNPQGDKSADVLAAPGSITALAFSHSGELLATGATDGTVKLWNSRTKSLLSSLAAEDRVTALSFHPRDGVLAIATDANQVSTWDIAAQRQLRILHLGKNFASTVAFAPNDLVAIGLHTAPPSRVATLRILMLVGGNKSSGDAVDAARADAVAIAGALKSSGLGSFGLIDQHMLIDGQLDVDRVRDAFISIARASRPEDSLFVYYVDPAAQPSGQSSQSLAFADGRTVSLNQVARWLEDIPASQQTIVLDSPGAIAQQNTLRGILANGSRTASIEQRKRLFLAFDRQPGDVQAGVLSQPAAMLIDGVSGKADLYPKDGRTTAAELRTYLDQRTLSLSEPGFKAKFELDGDDFDIVSRKALRGFGNLAQPAVDARQVVFQKRHDYALLIATDQYDSPAWPRLANPIQDATALKKELEDRYGFQVELLTNPTQDQVYQTLIRYQKMDFQPGDQLMIFFAGHGDFNEDSKEGFLVTRDSKSPEADLSRGSMIPHSSLRNYIDNIPVNHVLVVMDVCFGGTFDRNIAESGSRGGMYEDQPIDKLFLDRAQYTTRVFLTSGGKKYVPDGEPGHNSPFVHNLLGELRNPSKDRGYLTFADLQSAVAPTDPAPVWGMWGKNVSGSDFFLISRTTRPPSHVESKLSPTQPESAITQRPVVCFVGLKNLSGDASTDSLVNSITVFVTDGLGAENKLNVVPGQEVEGLKRSLPLESLSSYSKSTLLEIRQNTHADMVIAGSVAALGSAHGSLIVSFNIQNSLTGETIASVRLQGTQDGLNDLIGTAQAQLLLKLGVSDVSADQLAKATAGMPKTQKGRDLYSEAITQLNLGEAAKALDLFMKADIAEPGVPFVQVGLSDAWQELGYDHKAMDAATKAVTLGQGLPEQETGSIEARARVLQGKLSEAIDDYRYLLMTNPDKLQYGLKLVETETKAGQGPRALDDLASLERLPPPFADDPRIKLERADTYKVLGEFPKLAESAQQARDAAVSIGARLLAAQADSALCWANLNLGNNDQAVKDCQSAYDTYQMVGDKRGMALSQTGLATSLKQKADYSGALAKYQLAAEITDKIGDRTDRAGALQNSAEMLIKLGRIPEAEAALDEMTALYVEVGDKKLEEDAYFFSADRANTAGDVPKAQAVIAEALQVAQAAGDKDDIARAYSVQAMYDLEAGSLSDAIASAQKCIQIRTGIGERAEVAFCQQTMGDILLAQGHIPEAQSSYAAALALYQQLKQPSDIASIWLAQAMLSIEAGSPADGEALARQAAAEYASEKDADSEASSLSGLLQALVALNKRTEADQVWKQLAQLSPEDPDTQQDVALAEAHYRGLQGSFDAALARSTAAHDWCRKNGRVNCELEARLLTDQLRLKAAKTDGLAEEITALAAEASRLGFKLIADDAAKLSSAPALTHP